MTIIFYAAISIVLVVTVAITLRQFRGPEFSDQLPDSYRFPDEEVRVD